MINFMLISVRPYKKVKRHSGLTQIYFYLKCCLKLSNLLFIYLFFSFAICLEKKMLDLLNIAALLRGTIPAGINKCSSQRLPNRYSQQNIKYT